MKIRLLEIRRITSPLGVRTWKKLEGVTPIILPVDCWRPVGFRIRTWSPRQILECERKGVARGDGRRSGEGEHRDGKDGDETEDARRVVSAERICCRDNSRWWRTRVSSSIWEERERERRVWVMQRERKKVLGGMFPIVSQRDRSLIFRALTHQKHDSSKNQFYWVRIRRILFSWWIKLNTYVSTRVILPK